MASGAAPGAGRCAGFVDGHGRQQGQIGLESVPDPAGEIFTGRVLQPGDVVEIVVIEHLEQRLECGLEVGEVHHPTQLRVERAFDMDLDLEGMAVQPRALVRGRQVGQAMCCLDAKGLGDFH